MRKEYAGTTTEYVWDGDDLVHERRTVAGEHQPLVTWLFEPGTFSPVAKFEGKKRYSIVSDHLGTPSLLMTEAGKLAWKAQLDVYGVPREESAGIAKEDATGNPWRYPGQYEDAETGLYYNRFRYYDPETGRYISEDPIGLGGGLAQYGYVKTPVRRVDPLGLSSCGPSSPVPESYIDLEKSVDMSKTPIGPKTTFTKLGAPRDQQYFWSQLMERHPEMFSPSNKYKIEELGLAPRVDATWIEHNPTHVGFPQDTLVHHHLEHGPTAVPIPQTVHQKWSGILHD